ncbi:MAG: hypothetical protein CSB55_02225 [Candidatus Cloacimonadota bacterium]|nr:MAG: hypothetical protein CSB55_02225 [Candidatus Cloacimonadota bacterium]
MKKNMSDTVIIVPIYNGEKHLKELFSRIKKSAPDLKIIAVNDASRDRTKEILEKSDVIALNFTENKGKGAALRAGFNEAVERGFDYAISIDCDLQHKPEKIPELMKKRKKYNADLVIGRRKFKLGNMPPARIFSNTITTLAVSSVLGKKVFDSQSGFRLYNLNFIKKMQFETCRYQFETEILLKFGKSGARFAFVDIPVIYDDEISYISHGRDIANFIKILWKSIKKLA